MKTEEVDCCDCKFYGLDEGYAENDECHKRNCRYAFYPESEDRPIMFEPREGAVDHPNHYNHGGMECIDEMITVFGKEQTAIFCLLNVWKYRNRALYKNGEEDMKKANWYMAKYAELKGAGNV